jgi:hypothetical protein
MHPFALNIPADDGRGASRFFGCHAIAFYPPGNYHIIVIINTIILARMPPLNMSDLIKLGRRAMGYMQYTVQVSHVPTIIHQLAVDPTGAPTAKAQTWAKP